MTRDPEVLDTMRREWNARAREDANYYVAFGRRGQDDAEFFASAAEILDFMRLELQRLPAASRRAALEIGCGPGRLMRPASAFFAEIHGVDVSDEMVALAAARLADIPHAKVQATSGADLSLFADNYFDFVYSYAVFQHIPSRDVVFQYLAEARRVLKPGGILWCQVNGLPAQAARYTTWHGVRIAAAEIAEFARAQDLQLLRLDGIDTQYMWLACRKQVTGWCDWLQQAACISNARIHNIANAHTGEPATPPSGALSPISVWIENLPPDCDLNHMAVRIDSLPARACFIGPPQRDGLTQFNVALPQTVRTGLLPIEIDWLGKPLCPPSSVRVIPPGPLVPQICSLVDGVNLLSGARIQSGIVKVTMKEVVKPELFVATVDSQPVLDTDIFCTDPQARRFEINFHLPAGLGPGPHQVDIRLGRRKFEPIPIEVA